MTFSISVYHGCTLSLQSLLKIRHIAAAKFYYLILMFLCQSSRTFNLEQQVLYPFNLNNAEFENLFPTAAVSLL